MVWLKRKKQIITMGRRKAELTLLLTLLLIVVLLHLETSACFAEGQFGKSGRVFRRISSRSSSSSISSSRIIGHVASNSHEVMRDVKSQGVLFKASSATKQDHHKDGDEVFGAEKRKVYTGPNPLHNR